MPKRKSNYTYYFSVEGEDEKWYLEWLAGVINDSLNSLDADFTVSVKAEKLSPGKFVRKFKSIDVRRAVHVFDYDCDEVRFQNTLKDMKNTAGKTLEYRLGYTNLNFELWMVLHKMDCNGAVQKNDGYLNKINQAFGKSFRRIDDYKAEKIFKEILSGMNLDDVKQAIRRACAIQKARQGGGNQNSSGFSWFSQNPSLSLHERIQEILDECKNRVNAERREKRLQQIDSI